MRARTDLWEPWAGNRPGPPRPEDTPERVWARRGATPNCAGAQAESQEGCRTDVRGTPPGHLKWGSPRSAGTPCHGSVGRAAFSRLPGTFGRQIAGLVVVWKCPPPREDVAATRRFDGVYRCSHRRWLKVRHAKVKIVAVAHLHEHRTHGRFGARSGGRIKNMSLLQELLNLGLVDIGPDDSRFVLNGGVGTFNEVQGRILGIVILLGEDAVLI